MIGVRRSKAGLASALMLPGIACCVAGSCNLEPCIDLGRSWTVRGSVLQQDGSGAIAGATVEVFFWFAIDGPGNRSAPVVLTDSAGKFESTLRFTASCAPTRGGREDVHTGKAPMWLDVTVRAADLQNTMEFGIPENATLVDVEEIPGFGVEGTIELPPILVAVPP